LNISKIKEWHNDDDDDIDIPNDVSEAPIDNNYHEP
jgi:hypothetical protein